MPQALRIPTSFAAVFVVYWAYRLLAVPLIEPPARERWDSQGPIVETSADRLAGFHGLFEPSDWEREESTKLLQSDQVKLLWGEWTNHDDGTMEFRPCTVIFAPNGASAADSERAHGAIVLRAPHGAKLRFDQAFDPRRGTFGNLIGGQLDGPITLQGQGKSEGPDDDVQINTRNLVLAEEQGTKALRIHTDSPVEFSVGRNWGRGRGMNLRFLSSQDASAGKRHGMSVGGFEMLELVHLERLRLFVKPSGLGRNSSQPLLGDAKTLPGKRPSSEPLPLEIVCQGPFVFNMVQQVASFHEQVDLLLMHPEGPSDQISCEKLAVYFERRARAAGEAKPGDDENRSPISGLQPARVVAEGYPVTVRAPSQDLTARGESLEYDVDSQRIVLSSGPDGPQAFLRRGTSEIHGRRLDYRTTGQGQLGEATADGPGWLRVITERSNQPLEARWGQRLRLWRDGQGQPLLSMEGGAEVNYGLLGQLASPEIHLWLSELPPDANAGAKQNLRVLPDRMLAWQGRSETPQPIRLGSAQLSGKVEQLEVWFDHRAGQPGNEEREPRPVMPPVAAVPSPSPAMQKAMDLANRAPASLYTVMRPVVQVAAQESIGSHFYIEGKLLQALVRQEGDRSELAAVMVKDGVRFIETRTAKPDDKPLVVTGDRVHVVNASDPAATAMTVTGSPAHCEVRGLGLAGPSIHLNCGTNELRIEGAGQMSLIVPRDFQGQGVPGGMPLWIDWQDRMVFDGQTVTFEGSVKAATQDQLQTLRTETLKATFKQPIRFAEMKQQPKTEVEHLVCYGGVVMESREFDGQVQSSFQRVEVPNLEITMSSGEIAAGGPGRVTTIRRDAPKLGLLEPSRRDRQEDDQPADLNKPLNFLGVSFQKGIAGNLQWRRMTFHERVEAVFGPVPTWQDELRPGRVDPEKLGPQGAVLTCDQLSVTQSLVSSGKSGSMALEASSNVVVEGQNFTARAVRMTYDEAKGQVVLQGDGRNDARLFVTERIGDEAKKYDARMIQFWPATKNVVTDGLRILDSSSLPGRIP